MDVTKLIEMLESNEGLHEMNYEGAKGMGDPDYAKYKHYRQGYSQCLKDVISFIWKSHREETRYLNKAWEHR